MLLQRMWFTSLFGTIIAMYSFRHARHFLMTTNDSDQVRRLAGMNKLHILPDALAD